MKETQSWGVSKNQVHVREGSLNAKHKCCFKKDIFSSLFRITPIFTVSCVTGENLDLLKKFLNMLQPTKTSADQEKLAQALTQYEVRY